MSKLVSLSLVAVLVVAFAVAGCGGQKVTADEVPGAPVALQVPEVTKGGSDTLAGKSSTSSSSSSQDSADEEATPTPTPASSGQSGTSGTAQSGTAGGGTSGNNNTQQQTQQGNGTNGQSQGSGNTFDDFCKNNPGAC